MKKVIFILAGLILIFVLWDAWIFYFRIPDWKPVFTSDSPDGRFTVSVYYNPGLLPLPPAFSFHDNAGTVVLRENKTGKVLKRVVIDSAVDDESIVTWVPDYNRVSIVSVGGYDLPPMEPATP